MKVVSVTPAGRKKYLEILVPYLLREKKKGTINKHIFWLNTNVVEDVDYIKSLTVDPFFEVVEKSGSIFNCLNIHRFFSDCVDPDTIYIRFDDDICWIHEKAVENLIAARIKYHDAFLVYGNIINNCTCSNIHQRIGALPTEKGYVSFYLFDPIGWKSGVFAELVHRNFINKLDFTQQFYFNDWRFFPHLFDKNCVNQKESGSLNTVFLRERFSINVISWLGSTFSEFGGAVGKDEEEWLTVTKPVETKKYTIISGNSLFSHFSYNTQRSHLENTDLLNIYKNMSTKI